MLQKPQSKLEEFYPGYKKVFDQIGKARLVIVDKKSTLMQTGLGALVAGSPDDVAQKSCAIAKPSAHTLHLPDERGCA